MAQHAVGFIETRNWSALQAASDAMNKAADVRTLGQVHGGGGYVTTMVGGEVGSVRAAVAAGAPAARALGEFVSENVIPQLHPEVSKRFIEGQKSTNRVSANSSLGIVEAIGFVAMIAAADAGCKNADVELVGQFVPGGGYVAVVFRGEVAAVRAAVERGSAAASQVNQLIGSHLIPRPHPAVQLCFPIGGSNDGFEDAVPGRALGYIETKGFIPMIEAADAAVKASDTRPFGWQRVGSGFMAIILGGEVGAVRIAVDAGSQAARSVGEFKSALILPNPHEAVTKVTAQPKKKA